MRRNYLFGRLLGIVLAATLALSPAATALAASSEDAGIYSSSFEEEEETATEESKEEAEKGDDAATGNEAEEELPTEDGNGEASLENSSDAANEASSEELEEKEEIEEIEETEAAKDLFGAPGKLPSGAAARGEARSIGANVTGQIYTWKDSSNTSHVALYVAGDGTTINKKIRDVFSSDYKTITDVVFGGEILTIGDYAFEECEKLTRVTLPEELQNIGSSAFSGCALKEITIPASVIKMGSEIFDKCALLSTVTFAEGMTKIPDNALNAWDNNGHVKTVNIPSSATFIGTSAFEDQKELSKVNFNGAEITSIDDNAFRNCNSLKNISLPGTITSISSHAFEYCSFAAITLPEELQTIESRAFAGNSALKEITIPASVIKTSSEIFDDCVALSTVTFAEGMAKIPDYVLYAFGDSGHIKTVNIPSSATTVGVCAFENQRELKTVNFNGSQITTIETSAFNRCNALKSITLPDTLATIGDGAFDNCSLASITLPEGLQSIGTRAFAANATLKEITIPSTVITMESQVFDECATLATVTFAEGMAKIPAYALCAWSDNGHVKTVNIPSSVKVIGREAFEAQTELKTVNIKGAKITTIEDSAFKRCSALKSIDLPITLTSIGNYAFEYCALAGITLPKGLQSIGNRAFAGNATLKEITIPSTVTKMNEQTFDECAALTTVTFAEGMTKIPAYALYAWNISGHVKTVNIPSTAKTIGAYAFANQHELKNINFAGCVLESIEQSAFKGCNALKTIDLSSSKITTIESYTFEDCTGLISIDLPVTLKEVKYYAFNGCILLREVFYTGTEETKKKIVFRSGNDPLINATWKYLKAVTGVSLDTSSVLRYTDAISSGTKVTFKATVLPADASHLEVYAAKQNISGNAVSSVRVLGGETNVWTIEAALTGKAGTEKIVVTTVEGGHSASCVISVREKETARTPIFYLNGTKVSGTVEMAEGDRLSVGGTTVGSKTYYGTTLANCTKLLSDALVGGVDIKGNTTIYAVSKKDGFKDSAKASITVKYNAISVWGDVTAVDGEEFVDASEIPDGVWIPWHFLADTGLTYTGTRQVLGNLNVYYGNKLLSGKKDYTVSYKNNINAGTYKAENGPAVTITLKGNYGKASKSFGFTISPNKMTGENTSITAVSTAESKNKYGNFNELKPDLKVKVAGRALKRDADYDITYKKSGTSKSVSELREEGVYDVVIAGKGNYKGTVSFAKAVQVAGENSIKISALTISKTSAKQILPDWDGKDQNVFEQKIKLSYKGKEIPASAYTVIMPTITKAGKYTVTVEGSGSSFALGGKSYYIIGSKSLTFTVVGSVAMSKVSIKMPTVTELTYSPVSKDNELKGAVLTYNGRTMTAGKDYEVSYKNVSNAGTATVIYTGLGAFTGSAKRTYKISKIDISKSKVLNGNGKAWNNQKEVYAYVKGGIKPEVSLEGIPETAYSVTYINNKSKAAYAVGSAKNPAVKLTGKGNYTGSQTVYFSVAESDISKLSMTVGDLVVSAAPGKYAQTPVVLDSNGAKLVAGTDYEKKYTYKYACDTDVTLKTGSGKKAVTTTVAKSAGDEVDDKDIIPAGTMIEMTVTGKGNYKGTISETYVIAEAKISKLKFTMNYEEGKSSFIYTGKAIRPGKGNIKVETRNGSKWVACENGSDYYDIVSYTNNVNKGTATITVKGRNGYAGTAKITFKITAR